MSRKPEFERTSYGVRVHMAGASFYLANVHIERLKEFLEGDAPASDGGARWRHRQRVMLFNLSQQELDAEVERRRAEVGTE